MSTEIRKSSVCLNKEIFSGSGQTVCQTDVIVPDAMPDALKVLMADGRAVVESTVLGKGKIGIRGRVDCDLLYVPENARGVKSIKAQMPFSFSDDAAKVDENMMLYVSAEVSHIEYQLVNSRKISVKAVVEMKICVTGKEEIKYVSGLTGDEAEVKEKKLKGKNNVVCCKRNFAVSEKIPVSEKAEKLLKCDAEIKSKDVKIINNKVVAKGEVEVSALYCTEGEMPDFVTATLPFTEILDAEGISEKQLCRVDYFIKETGAEIVDTEDGKAVSCSIVISVNICSDEEVEFTAVNDVYGTKTILKPQTKSIDTSETADKVFANVEIREIVTLENEMPQIEKVYALNVKPYINECTAGAAGVKADGTAVCSVIYISGKEDAYVQSAQYSIPFGTVFGGSYDINSIAKPEAELVKAEYSLSGSDIEIRASVKISAEVLKNHKSDIVTDITEEEEVCGDRPAMVLYFVQRGDTPWEIAKKYHSKISEIEQINKLESGEIKEGMMLLIPKK